MPGISFICDFKEDLRNKENLILQSLDSLIHFEHYKKDILINEKSYFLGCTLYDGYPMSHIDNNEHFLCIEGKLYGKDERRTRIELNYLANTLNGPIQEVKEGLSEWLLNTDGDFVIFVLNKRNNEINIINDALGRLPLYYYKGNKKLIVSREVRFIKHLIGGIKFDRMAIAQYLLFCYPLGKRTLFENVNRLEPATIIRIKLCDSQIEINNIFQFNFDKKKYASRNIEDNANHLVDLFNEACKDRNDSFKDYNNILSLSGGLDSRSVGACLQKNDIPFCGATFLDFNKTSETDVKIAKQLADIFNIDLNVIVLSPPKGKDNFKLLRIKNGLNYLSMSFILPFFDKIKEIYRSRIIYITGDGGDKFLHDIGPFKKLSNLDELINYIILNNQIFSLDRISVLTGIQKNELIDNLKNHLISYPEKEYNQKYVHFIIYERGFKWLFEGEDRNRFYFLSITPFYSIQFVNYAMNCPDSQKSNYRLYRKFLNNMNPEASKIDYADYGMPITSKKFNFNLLMRSIFNKLPATIKTTIKKVAKKPISYKYDSTIIKCLRDQLKNCNHIGEYLSQVEIENILNNPDIYRKQDIETLFTITSTIEDYHCNESTIEKYFEIDFI
ncbi:asparagine synthetase [glutamine-hydrolyzing] 1 [bacterium BMS3Abin07]|nr:asparagine synthetase [glutamine-hydrolyzing] 1 [bacterium BMS3Abin07]